MSGEPSRPTIRELGEQKDFGPRTDSQRNPDTQDVVSIGVSIFHPEVVVERSQCVWVAWER
jgi:hypothetical protein